MSKLRGLSFTRDQLLQNSKKSKYDEKGNMRTQPWRMRGHDKRKKNKDEEKGHMITKNSVKKQKT